MSRLRRTLARLLPTRPRPQATAADAGPGSIAYAPERNDRPDPGEVVWGWVPYEDDPNQGKDRPVLLIGTRGDRWLGLMLSSKDHDVDAADEARHGRHWMDVGAGGWDRSHRPSEVRLDRLLELEPGAIRREGAALSPDIFVRVVAEARKYHDLPGPPG
jgi:hypothetical protein